MVGPVSDEERREATALLKAGVVALVGVSAGLITLSGGGSAVEIAVAVGAGLAAGAALLAYLVWTL